jgi:outer membrane protein TolC
MGQNPQLRSAVIEWRRARLAVTSEDYQFVPNLFAEGGYQAGRQPSRSTAATGVSLLSTESIRMAAGIDHLFATGTRVSAALEAERSIQDSVVLGNLGETYGLGLLFEITQPWLRGFGRDVLLADLYAARLREDAALAERDSTASALARQVLVSYWDLWFAQRQLEITRAAIETAERELEQAQERLTVGQISEADLIPLQTEMARLEEDLVAGRALVDDASIELARLLGGESYAAPRTTGWATIAEPPEPEALPALATALEIAEARSYELRRLELSTDVAKIEARVADNLSLPRLDSTATLRISGLGEDVAGPFDQIGGLEGITGFVGLRLELPIVDTGLEAQAERAQLGVDSARATYQAAKDSLQAQVASSLNNLEATSERLELARRTAELAERQVEVQTTLFQNGRATMLDVVEATQQLNVAKLRVVSAQVDLAQLRLALEDTTGTLLERLSVEL